MSDNEEQSKRIRNAVALYLDNIPAEVIVKSGTEWQLIMEMDENTFRRHLRVSKAQFHFVAHKLQEKGMSDVHPCGGPENIPMVKKIIMFLWYLANQNSFRELSDKFDVSQGAAHKVIVEVLDLTCLLASSFITWPTHCEKRTNAVLFRRACGIDGIVGAIDGCHIRIQRPPVRGGDYLNRKSFYSILLQGIVDDQGSSSTSSPGLQGGFMTQEC
ncbi:hypothetical protein AAFF_G00083580 [Aldrovandia affinis]|uniref:DDE Tnp4 domain-containing protein n=1 Tax=Aldrovandia affinis TaxID=143900 RepID=A0AAD7R230_9TELE|nr:hypothetical protein AAFF_G00083580 [Aldrovandia affinis]